MSSILTRSHFQDAGRRLDEASVPGPPKGVTGAMSRLGDRLREGLRQALRRMPPLVLELTDSSVTFRTLEEFEFSLHGRTEFPASRIEELMRHTPVELEAAARRIHDTERHFSEIIARSLHEPALLGELFRELELKLFSQDHGWRDIIDALARLSPAFDPYKRIALIKYMQYLRARQTLMRCAFVEKTRDDASACLHATPAMGETMATPAVETAAFETPAPSADEDTLVLGYRSLPKGEPVEVALDDARHMELLLAGNRMRLYLGRECYMVDDDDRTYPLHEGSNLVGRHAGCDVVVDAACKAVSRTHLVVEPLPGARVRLTDLSSHGTEVVAHLLDAA